MTEEQFNKASILIGKLDTLRYKLEEIEKIEDVSKIIISLETTHNSYQNYLYVTELNKNEKKSIIESISSSYKSKINNILKKLKEL